MRNAGYDPKNNIPTVKAQRWKHYAVELFSVKGAGRLHHIGGPMDGDTCCKILDENHLPSEN